MRVTVDVDASMDVDVGASIDVDVDVDVDVNVAVSLSVAVAVSLSVGLRVYLDASMNLYLDQDASSAVPAVVPAIVDVDASGLTRDHLLSSSTQSQHLLRHPCAAGTTRHRDHSITSAKIRFCNSDLDKSTTASPFIGVSWACISRACILRACI
jgi:hypothetical protein